MSKNTASTLSGRTIRCILFDLGETLWTHIYQDDTLAKVANERALVLLRACVSAEALDGADLPALRDGFRAAVIIKTRELAGKTPGYEPDFARVISEVLPQFALPPLDRTSCAELFEAIRIPILGSRRLFADTLSTLAALQQRGFLLGVVTNRHWGGPFFLHEMQSLGLFDYFAPPCIAISADLGIRKPNPAIFLHTLNALNVAPREAAMVGDSLHADIAGAKGLDMYAVWKPKSHQRAAFMASHIESAQDVDDDTFFSYVLEREDEKYQQKHEPVRPDVTIEHVRDLLEIFVKVGPQ